MKGKTLKQITNTSKAGLKEIPSLPSNEDFTIDLISKQSSKVYKINVNELNSGTGGGIQSIQEGDNITVDNTDPLNPIVSASGDSTSALFPNGIEFVNASRDFRASDAGKRLFINGDSIIVSMPTDNPFAVGDYVGVIAGGNGSGFNVEHNGDIIFPLKIGDGSTSECVVLMNTEIEGSSWLFPISTSFKYDNTDSKKKTALKYLYDQSQNAIPLSGTVSGSPVTGNIEFVTGYGENGIIKTHVDEDFIGSFILADNNSKIRSRTIDNSSYCEFTVNSTGININSINPSSQGITSTQDFTPNITDLDYTQKIYVGFRGTATLSSGTVTVTTDKIKTGYKIYLSVNTPSGTQGFLSAPTGSIVDETEFVINSTSATDDSTVNWWITP